MANKLNEVRRTPGSTYSLNVYKVLWDISNNVDFRHPIFMTKRKRSRSIASVQALLVELALADEKIMNQVRGYMVDGGRDYRHIFNYVDRY